MKNSLKCEIPTKFYNYIYKVTYSGAILYSKFTNIKNKTVKEHQNDIAYYVKCPEDQCSEDYPGETAQRLLERVFHHNGRDSKSNLVKHVIKKCHRYPKIENFNIIGKDYRNDTFKRKFAESLLIKEIRPTIKTHEKSVSLKLSN